MRGLCTRRSSRTGTTATFGSIVTDPGFPLTVHEVARGLDDYQLTRAYRVLAEVLESGKTLRADTLRTPEIFSLVLVMYFAVAFVLSRGMRELERRQSHWRQAGNRP